MSVVKNLSFSAQIDAWVAKIPDRAERVWKESTKRVVSIANNGVPVDLGFARASIRGSTESMPAIDPDFDNKERKPYADAFGEIVLLIENATLGQTIYVGWTASYVLPLEFGHSKQAPSGFVRLAAAQWPRIVGEVTAEAKARSSAQ